MFFTKAIVRVQISAMLKISVRGYDSRFEIPPTKIHKTNKTKITKYPKLKLTKRSVSSQIHVKQILHFKLKVQTQYGGVCTYRVTLIKY